MLWVYLVTPQVVAVLGQQVGDLLHVDRVVERRGVADLALVCRNLRVHGGRGTEGDGITSTFYMEQCLI